MAGRARRIALGCAGACPRGEAPGHPRPAHRRRRARGRVRAPRRVGGLTMSRIEDLADLYAKHIETPWQRTVSGAQRVIMVVYDKQLERALRARKAAFEMATRNAGHAWYEVDLTDAFSAWLGKD